MKAKYILLIALLLLMSVQAQYPNHINIKVAADNQYIKYEINGKKSGTHYTKALTLNIQNISVSDWKIHIPNGMVMEAHDVDYQNFIITNEEMITLKAGEVKEIALFAMCIEKNDIGPGENEQYYLGEIANKKLTKVSQFIQDHTMFQPEGQYALWAVSDNYPIYNIAGFDTSAQRQLQALVANVTNQSIPAYKPSNDYMTEYYDVPMQLTIGGEFEYKFRTDKSVTIAMFDTNNIVVRELFKNPLVKPGYHKFEYEFDGSIYTDEVYFIKLIVNGEVKLNLKLAKV
ncbi:MAG: hypothetical protein HOM80_08595 [Bacteroidetes bacterium]|jgi:hypothetical protein|nr:hypothetical protein [Bacteroidota bacterium]MBT4727954.1 hypothetical protein [Bacteroidota bacterium]MBT4969053.1 hypothetical protein [Bacteroidota bacterium]